MAPQLVVRRVLDAPERYESLRDWLADQWRLPAADRSPDAAAIFAELGLDAETPVKRPLLVRGLPRARLGGARTGSRGLARPGTFRGQRRGYDEGSANQKGSR